MLDFIIFFILTMFFIQIPFILLEKEIKIKNFVLFGDNTSIVEKN